MGALVNAHTADNWVSHQSATWTSLRNAAGGSLTDADANAQYSDFGIYIGYGGGRGASQFYLRRTYIPFDLTYFSGTASAAELKIWLRRLSAQTIGGGGVSLYINKICAVSADSVIPVSTNSSDDEDYFGNIGTTLYSGYVTPSNILSEHTITLNSNALTAINNAVGSESDGIFTLCITAAFDYLNTTPGPPNYTGFLKVQTWYGDSTSRKPYLNITGVGSIYEKEVYGIHGTNVARVNGISTDKISKVNGV